MDYPERRKEKEQDRQCYEVKMWFLISIENKTNEGQDLKMKKIPKS